jgi:hypothetical protein
MDWLPALVLFEDYESDWGKYLEAVYAFFVADFVDAQPTFGGKRLGLKRHPIEHGKEATFWHMIQEGDVEAERTPDFRRMERVRWPRPIIDRATEHGDHSTIKIWRNMRRNESRVLIWMESAEYLVVLADRGDYILPWTAYPVDREHRKKKLQKEYEAYRKSLPQKG